MITSQMVILILFINANKQFGFLNQAKWNSLFLLEQKIKVVQVQNHSLES